MESFDAPEVARTSQAVFQHWRALECEALGAGNDKSWRLKPKAHMAQELLEFQAGTKGSPELFWTYVDESHVGSIAAFSKRRGGARDCKTLSERVLTRYRAMNNLDGL